jgi:two-component system, NarL family, response regulator NreC
MTRLILAEDHQLVREGIRLLLEEDPSIQVLAEAGDGLEAAELTEKHRPDLLLLDLSMPRLDGVSVIRRILQSTSTKVLVLSVHGDDLNVRESLSAGALGYVLKESTPENLLTGIRSVMRGDPFLSPGLRRIAVDAVVKPNAGQLNPCKALTARERVVLEHASSGMANAQIAAKLFVSARTVESHRASLMKKLGLKGQTELVRFAIRQKIISP